LSPCFPQFFRSSFKSEQSLDLVSRDRACTRRSHHATAAQIEANRRNARKSCGPKTDAGKAKTRLNALKHGGRARKVVPVLPQEDPGELDSRIRQWTQDMKPGNPAECELVARAAKVSPELDRLERCDTAQLTVRVREAQLRLDKKTTDEVCDLSRKLLYMAGSRSLPTSGPPWDDNPAALLRGLEATAEGCRWLLQKWTELRDMFHRGDPWTLTDLYRSFRLQGKHPVDAVTDPELNRQFLAWEVLEPEGAVDFWKRCYEMTPRVDPGFQGFMEWRELAERPADEDEARDSLKAMMAGQIARLEELIEVHAEIDGEDAVELADAASFDPGPEAERRRKQQMAKARELRQALELFLKMQAANRKASREGEAPAERDGTSASTRARGPGHRGVQDRSPGGSPSRYCDGEGTEEGRPAAKAAMPGGTPAGREQAAVRAMKRPAARAPFVLPEALEMVVAGGLAEEIRAIARKGKRTNEAASSQPGRIWGAGA
jgi:hypothetical protein